MPHGLLHEVTSRTWQSSQFTYKVREVQWPILKLVNGGSGLRCALNSARGSGESGKATHLRVGQLAEVGCDVEEDALLGPRQRNSTEEQDDQHDVGIGGGEVNHLGGKSATMPPPARPSFPPPTSLTSLSVVALRLLRLSSSRKPSWIPDCVCPLFWSLSLESQPTSSAPGFSFPLPLLYFLTFV